MKPGIDLRSDAVTRPTDEMWDAMRSAQLGWAPTGEDENVRGLEDLVSDYLGKQAGLFLHGGGTANLLALLSQTERGDQIIVDDLSHILWAEECGFAWVGSLMHCSMPAERGQIAPAALEAAFRAHSFRHRPTSALVCVENSHNAAGGAALPADHVSEIARIAHAHGARLHVDGARLLNAAAALGCDARALVADADSVSFNLNKGLSAPIGAVLCSDRETIDRARVLMKRIGAGTPHQAGIFAAAGLVSMKTMIPQHAIDNRRAASLAARLAALADDRFRLWPVETNIVFVSTQTPGETAVTLQAILKSRGVLVSVAAENTIRMATHRHIGDEEIEVTAAAFHALV